MTDVTLQNPIVTAVQAVKSGNDVVPVSSSNPLPTALPFAWTTSADSIKGRFWIVRTPTVAGVAAKYTAIQIRNPTGSGKNIVIAGISIWGSSGTNTFRIVKTSAADLASVVTTTTVNFDTSVSTSSAITVTSDNLVALTATNILNKTSISSTAVDIGASTLSTQVIIRAGDCIQVECESVNIGAGIAISLLQQSNS